MTRKHHCRMCGQIYCYNCSQYKKKHINLGIDVKVCVSCNGKESPETILPAIEKPRMKISLSSLPDVVKEFLPSYLIENDQLSKGNTNLNKPRGLNTEYDIPIESVPIQNSPKVVKNISRKNFIKKQPSVQEGDMEKIFESNFNPGNKKNVNETIYNDKDSNEEKNDQETNITYNDEDSDTKKEKEVNFDKDFKLEKVYIDISKEEDKNQLEKKKNKSSHRRRIKK